MAKFARIGGSIRRLFSDRDGSDGAMSVEFALISPVFVAFLYGIVEFGRVLFTLGVLNFAAEEATRYSVVNYNATTTQIRQVAESKFLMIDPAKITNFNVTSTLNATDQTKLVSIEITYAFEPWVPIGWSGITLSGNSRSFIIEK